jgi:hypothetical protein
MTSGLGIQAIARLMLHAKSRGPKRNTAGGGKISCSPTKGRQGPISRERTIRALPITWGIYMTPDIRRETSKNDSRGGPWRDARGACRVSLYPLSHGIRDRVIS